MRPRCCLRYLTFFGINMMSNPYRSREPRLSSVAALRTTRRPIAIFLVTADPRHQALALVEPHLHADLAVGRARFGEAVVDVGAQRLQRQLAVQIPFGAGDLRAVQPAGDAHLDAARAEAQRRLHRLAHGPPERHALLELHGHRLGDQLRLELRLLDLLDVDEDLPVGALLDLLLQLVDFRALAADDDARTRGVDVDLQVVRRALGLDPRDARVREALLEVLAQRQVLVQQLRVIAVGEPARAPGLVEAEPETVRVNLLAHEYLLSKPRSARRSRRSRTPDSVWSSCFVAFVVTDRYAVAPAFLLVFRARAGLAAAAPPVPLTRAIFRGRSATFTVRCAERLTTRNARPIGAGRTRFIDGP